jgi:two-component system, cell cycle sensor histidine kinase and response regulator CckA
VDVMMPGIGGFDTVLALQKMDKHLRVIMMSGLISSETKAQCQKLGCRSILAKPFTTGQLLQLLQTNLEISSSIN